MRLMPLSFYIFNIFGLQIMKFFLFLLFYFTLNYIVNAQPVGCHYVWSQGLVISPAIPATIPDPLILTGSTSRISLKVNFYDWDQIQNLPGAVGCIPGAPAISLASSLQSNYSIRFEVNSLNFATLSPDPNILMQARTVGAEFSSTAYNIPLPGGAGTVYVSDVLSNQLVLLTILPAWVLDPVHPDIIVTATIRDITGGAVPPGDIGNSDDPIPLTIVWTIRYSTNCPSILSLSPITSANNTWINILGNHSLNSCFAAPVIDDVPFCYIASGPVVGANYNGEVIFEFLGDNISDFNLNDLNPGYRNAFPAAWTANEFAKSIFPKATSALFTISNANTFEDHHNSNILNPTSPGYPIVNVAFTPDAIANGRVGYHFSQDYICSNNILIVADVYRKLLNALTPQLKKVH